MDPINLDNPFPIEAVATFGASLRTSAALFYMTRPQKELRDYLLAHAKTDTRYGGAIGLRGGHGSGKTHLLGWLAEQVRELRRSDPTVVYGKADSASFFDLYKQLASQIDRPRLITLLSLATQNIAIEQVKTAKVTESLQDRIKAMPDLTRLYNEGNLDREEVTNLLDERLRHAGRQQEKFPEDLARVLLSVGSSVAGDVAYQWLLGNDVDTSTLGLTYQLRQLNQEQAGSADPDRTAIEALELIAALHALAGAPFVVLIDQLEILFRTTDARQQIGFSLIKKLIEQTGGQHALMFIAGADEAWDRLPRDVPPRMRLREPLPVGNLTTDETVKLLAAYQPIVTVPSNVAQTMYELSGGSPREIIRIAHHAFKDTGGHLDRADEAILLKGAQDSGTIADRSALAISIADDVLSVYGQVTQNLALDNGVVIDRLLRTDATPMLALQFVHATDKLTEANSALSVTAAKTYLERAWPDTTLVVIAIGYSSSAVQALLAKATQVTIFNETTFRNELQRIAVELIARREKQAQQRRAEPDANLLALLQTITNDIQTLKTHRQTEAANVGDRFAQSTAAVAAEETQRREVRTRWEMLEELDRLGEALKKGTVAREREIIRTILVANETYVKNVVIDGIGGMYLDVVSTVMNADKDPSIPRLREYMIGRMRRSLIRPSLMDRVRISWAAVTVAATTLGFLFGLLLWRANQGVPPDVSYFTVMPYAWSFELLFAASFGIATFVLLRLLTPDRRIERDVRAIVEKSG